jgi:hypothetical protein
VAASARLEDTVLWDDVRVGDGARLIRCVVADGARIPARAEYHECAIAPRSAAPDGGTQPGREENGLVIAALDPYAG